MSWHVSVVVFAVRHFHTDLSFTNMRRLELMRWEVNVMIFLNWGYKLETWKCACAGQL